MNRLILKYGYPITFVILAILAWVVYRIFSAGGSGVIGFVVLAAVVWGVGTVVFLYLWPTFAYSAYKRAILQHGPGGPIPVNTLYATPNRVSAGASNASLLATGVDDLLYVGGWLDLANGPLVLHVPEMAGRYYSVQFTDPSDGTDFAYVGTRTTGTAAGEYLISGPSWKGTVPQGMAQITSPNKSVLVIGRVFVESDSDLPTAYGLAKQIRLTPLSH
ncbi:MAG: hypothetical protein OJF49_003102 [Ktedonobacterales bacterium]|jgi:hypothetical protein|nr:MAG: hypothetical protein OJF49_003102 [Ktedonobacterales bacterium]